MGVRAQHEDPFYNGVLAGDRGGSLRSHMERVAGQRLGENTGVVNTGSGTKRQDNTTANFMKDQRE
jgi:hypothetical protein